MGWGPQQKGFPKESQRTTQVGVAPTERNAKRISSSTASWGGPNRDSLGHHYILGYERYILAVVDWIENTLISSFFHPFFGCFICKM
ncbi:hypothetical protein FH149_02955 [Staphylococcus lugdunensis]|uniref:hypothetical protein n=1 Tax=Staphylococcus lugdunensis TaxID=28035 RepID=UPI000685A39C|nr:hypothetical protein [Staphylococcus lugdunensis]MCI2844489.1 hypothetical protein [Staphylococcus lugdunensis]